VIGVSSDWRVMMGGGRARLCEGCYGRPVRAWWFCSRVIPAVEGMESSIMGTIDCRISITVQYINNIKF